MLTEKEENRITQKQRFLIKSKNMLNLMEVMMLKVKELQRKFLTILKNVNFLHFKMFLVIGYLEKKKIINITELDRD